MIAPSSKRDAPAVGGGACALSGAEAHTGEGAGGNAESGTGEAAGGNAASGAGAAGVVDRRTAITIMYSFWPFWHRSSSLLMKKNGPDRSSLNTERSELPLLPTAWSRRTGLRVLHVSKSCSVTSSTESTPSSCVNTASQEEGARTSHACYELNQFIGLCGIREGKTRRDGEASYRWCRSLGTGCARPNGCSSRWGQGPSRRGHRRRRREPPTRKPRPPSRRRSPARLAPMTTPQKPPLSPYVSGPAGKSWGCDAIGKRWPVEGWYVLLQRGTGGLYRRTARGEVIRLLTSAGTGGGRGEMHTDESMALHEPAKESTALRCGAGWVDRHLNLLPWVFGDQCYVRLRACGGRQPDISADARTRGSHFRL